MKPIIFSLAFLGSFLPGSGETPPKSGRAAEKTPKVMPCLWFGTDGEEAIRFYRSVFRDSKVVDETRWGPGGMAPEGSLMAATIEISGQRLLVLTGGQEKFTEATSMLVNCETQEEIDELWKKLTDGGTPGQCGWLKDRFGVPWQIVPRELGELLRDPDPAKAARVGAAMMQMQKLDVAALKKARDGK